MRSIYCFNFIFLNEKPLAANRFSSIGLAVPDKWGAVRRKRLCFFRDMSEHQKSYRNAHNAHAKENDNHSRNDVCINILCAYPFAVAEHEG